VCVCVCVCVYPFAFILDFVFNSWVSFVVVFFFRYNSTN